MKKEQTRTSFKSRWGFILASVGSAVGMANVWGFPNKMGSNGGGAFLLIYLLFIFLFSYVGLPAEFAIGRWSHTGTLGSYENAWRSRNEKLAPAGRALGWLPLAGSLCIAIGYSIIVAYVLKAFVDSASGLLMQVNTSEWFESFSMTDFSVVPFHIIIIIGTLLTLLLGASSIEKSNKIMMPLFFLIFVVLAARVALLPGSASGYEFMFIPRWEALKDPTVWITAMGQAFFTLSLGIGAMAIFGSYIGKEHALLGESVRVVVLDTFVAITAGLIIFPACFTYGVDQTSGPSLIFITLPNIFANMAMGRLWGSLFFLFMAFAALSTVLAVFENIICCGMELTGWNRQKSSLVNFFLIIALSLPCVLGYNVWAWDGFAIFGGAVLDVEDFLVSNLFLPLGSLVYLLFCITRYGWGWDNYKKEVNTGDGLKMHDWMRGYLTYGLPLIVLFIFVFGLYDKFIA